MILLKKIKKDKKYFFSKKDIILVEALKVRWHRSFRKISKTFMKISE